MTSTLPASAPSFAAVLAVRDGAGAIEFYRAVFGASVRFRLDRADGSLNYAELEVATSVFMVAGEVAGGAIASPSALGGTSVRLSIYVDDVDAVYARALEGGARSVNEVKDQFYGDRTGQFRDPFGHVWNVATRVEDVSPDEVGRRAGTGRPNE